MTVWAVLRQSPLESVSIQLTSKMARELAAQLLRAAEVADVRTFSACVARDS